jgi:transcriptional regulator with XRE-family HTH domain
MSIVKRVGRNIKRVRTGRRWTQQVLADRVGTSRFYVAQLEAGSKQCSLEMLERVAKALGVKVTRLLE